MTEPVSLKFEDIDEHIFNQIPLKWLKSHCALPFKEDEDSVFVAFGVEFESEIHAKTPSVNLLQKFEPNAEILDKAQSFLKHKFIKAVAGNSGQIRAILAEFELKNKIATLIKELKFELSSTSGAEQKSAVSKLFELIITQSVEKRASDIHIEPSEKEAMIRFRVDGVLSVFLVLEREIYEKFGEIAQNNEPKSPKNADLKRLDMAKIADKSDRQCAKSLFDYYKMQKQIAFITFHQNFSYEEFIEGIKPEIENSGKSDIIYIVKDGIFKEICADALENLENSQKSQRQLNEEFSIKELFEAFAEDAQRRLDEGETINFSTPSLNTKKNITKINYFKNGETKSIAISADLQPVQVLTRDIVLRDYENFKKGIIKSRKDVKPSLDSQSAWHGNGDYYFALYERLRDFEKTKFKPERNVVQSVDLKPFILIIDEINRGNIAKILGELITLLEPSKRIGNDEEIRVSLPYSENKFDGGRGFGVPKNLYLIGTMNTADRSIALLDTALRRRFEFVEMMPNAQLLKSFEAKNADGKVVIIDLQKLLEKMNERIEFLLDREHTLGHSFFIDITSLEALKNAFKTKIIPLLQEYFYEDYAKIDAVLNENGMVKIKENSTFAKLFDFSDDLDSEKIVYEITDFKGWKKWQFVQIYDKAEAEKLKNEQD